MSFQVFKTYITTIIFLAMVVFKYRVLIVIYFSHLFLYIYIYTSKVRTTGSGMKGWDWRVATEDFQWLENEGLGLNGCQQKVATDGLWLNCYKGNLGTEGLGLRRYIWRVPTECLWLTGQASGNWSFATEGAWDWRLQLNGCDILHAVLPKWGSQLMLHPILCNGYQLPSKTPTPLL